MILSIVIRSNYFAIILLFDPIVFRRWVVVTNSSLIVVKDRKNGKVLDSVEIRFAAKLPR